ncbi:MAG: hypothetical protein JXJ17_04200 [Anaerolineae bacterium]|nr:hypothetical protein [Anaerolineae bacterium]
MFDQIINLVGQPPGSLVYHFIIFFAVEAAFAISIGQWMRERDTGTFRLALSIFLLFFGRVIVLIASLAAWQGFLPRNVLLPPVERAVDTLTIASTAWAFITMNTPDLMRRNFLADVLAAGTIGLILIAFGGTYYFWGTGTASEQLFNGLWIDVVWAIAQIGLALIGLVWMSFRFKSIYDFSLKGLTLLILGSAAAIHLGWPVLGDVASVVRIGQILAMPMLAAIAYRHVVEQLLNIDTFEPSWLTAEPASTLAVPPGMADPAPVPPPGTFDETVRTDKPEPVEEIKLPVGPPLLDVVDAVGGLLVTLEPAEIVQEAPRVVATALRSDVCALAIVDEDVVQAAIVGGYDNISQAPLPQGIIDLADHPSIVNALGRLRQMRLTTQRNARELRDIYRLLGITHEGPAFIQPLVNGEERIGVLIAASPYSTRMLSNEERDLLDRLGPLVTAALLNAETFKEVQEQADAIGTAEATRAADLADGLTARTSELNTALRQIEEMKSYIRDLHRQLDEVPLQQEAAREKIALLTAEADRLRDRAKRVEELETEVETLQKNEENTKNEINNSSVKEEKEEVYNNAAHLLAKQQLEEARMATQTELAALRVRLAQAQISQQEVAFLQEELGTKAREIIKLQTRLTEAQAVGEALREQVSSGLTSTRELEVLQKRVGDQASEVARLKAQLAEAQAVTNLNDEAVKAQESMDQADREAMAQLEAQLIERTVSMEALERQLSEKAQAVATLKSHMADVDASLKSMNAQLDHKTEEVQTLQQSLAETREQARQRIAALKEQLDSGLTEASTVDQARVEALEVELAEKAVAIETLEGQLDQARLSMSELEEQLQATNTAVDAAIIDAKEVDFHDEVIASIAQELRTPMSSIIGYTELLLRESVGILGPLQRKFLQRVKANTERMGTLLDDLIRISTLDTGSMQLEPEKVDVFYAIEEVVMRIANQYAEKELSLYLTLPEALPPITTDREALTEVIQHLLINAGLASPVEGEVEIRATAEIARIPTISGEEISTDCLSLAVEDTGGGISPEDYERVFMRKYRADNPLIEGLGDTGVSLSLAKALVEAQGGQIWLESEQGTGTTFFVLLPLEPISQGEQA